MTLVCRATHRGQFLDRTERAMQLRPTSALAMIEGRLMEEAWQGFVAYMRLFCTALRFLTCAMVQTVLVPAEFLGLESAPDCVACNFGRGRASLVAAYADGCMAVWDVTNLEEVRPSPDSATFSASKGALSCAIACVDNRGCPMIISTLLSTMIPAVGVLGT